jgi:hypothetical protein
MAEPRLAKYKDIVPAKTVLGSTVVNSNYQDLGKIEDLVLEFTPSMRCSLLHSL